MAGTITLKQKHRVIVCLPKPHGNHTPEDYRPITLHNSDYKILARITAQQLCPVLEDHLLENQIRGVPQNTVLDAVATVRDTIAYADSKKMCYF